MKKINFFVRNKKKLIIFAAEKFVITTIKILKS